jgi:flagellar protein FliS
MYHPNAQAAMQQYNQVHVYGNVVCADPHRLVQLLFEGVLDRIAAAKGCIAQGKVAEKGWHISRAIATIDGLRLNLDTERGGDIARHLDDLYDYIERRLLHANIENDLRLLNEVAGLLGEIKGGWDAIAGRGANTAAAPVAGVRVPMVG